MALHPDPGDRLRVQCRGFAQPPHSLRNGFGTRWDRLEIKRFSGPDGFDAQRQAIPAGKYKTISIDPVDKLWEWATLSARRKVGGPTGDVPQSKTGQMWGEAKRSLADWLLDLSGKCDWLFLMSHMHIQWPPPPPPAKPTWYSKAGAVVQELSDVMLTLERDKRGFNPPSAYISQGDDGKTRYPAIPPRIPVFTPLSLLYYMQADPSQVDLSDPDLLPLPIDDGMALLEKQVELAERMQRALANPEDEALPEGELD